MKTKKEERLVKRSRSMKRICNMRVWQPTEVLTKKYTRQYLILGKN